MILNNRWLASIFCDVLYCDNIKQTKPIEVKTNGRSIMMNQECTVPDLGQVYCAEESLTNIIRLKDMRQKYRVTYDLQ